jgi:myo-inositol 2-dehydrogenase / D-chiro-inositol 1-dehydrogenase
MNTNELSRRRFLKNITAAGAAMSVLPATSFGITGSGTRKIRVGAIGVGGRGRGAMDDIRNAAAVVGVELEFVGVADVPQSTVERVGEQFGVPAAHRFSGFDGYRKLLEVPMDVVIMATPPNFRPLHFEAAVAAGVHSFIEKPVAVDAPGARRMYLAGKEAERKGLSVVAGTQRRHAGGYLSQQKAIADGAIGKIVGGKVMWCMNQLWIRPRNPGESNAEYLARNWVNFLEMSGDHIVEQHMHNIDIANWFIGRTPRLALGFGGRARRRTGNLYDFFSVDYDYGEDCNIHSMSRQINGTYTRVGEWLTGTEGRVTGGGRLSRFDGVEVNLPTFETHNNALVQEHVDLLRSILNEEGLNETEAVTDATVAAMMGRISAYSGKIVRWVDLTERADSEWYNVAVSPTAEDFESGDDVAMPAEETAPIPGEA